MDPNLPVNQADDWDIVSYAFDVSFDFAGETAAGTVDLEADRTGTGPMVLHANGPIVSSIVDRSTLLDVPYTVDGETITLALDPLLPSVSLRVTYSNGGGVASDDVDSGAGMGLQWAAEHVYSQNETTGARRWLVVDDTSEDRATVSWTLTVPEAYIAVGNGVQVAPPVDNGDGTVTWTWALDQPISTYLMAVHAGELEQRILPGDVDVWVWARPDRIDQAEALAGVALDQLDWFADWLAPYPYPHYGVAYAAEFAFGGMENPTLVTMNDVLLDDPYSNEMVLLHEMGHHWFGDLVTIEQWEDLWLNEGFATYCELLWTEQGGGYQQSPGNHVDNWEFTLGYYGDTPLVDPNATFPNATVYVKGAATLHALRRELGDDAFFTLLERWVTERAETAVVSQDLVDLATEVAGRPMDGFFDPWLHDDAPRFDVTYGLLDVGGAWQVDVEVAQPGARHVLDYPLTVLFADGSLQEVSVRLDAADGSGRWCFDRQVAAVLPDAEHVVLDLGTTHALGDFAPSCPGNRPDETVSSGTTETRGTPADARGATADGGAATAGCGCRSTQAPTGPLSLLAALGTLGALRRRRR